MPHDASELTINRFIPAPPDIVWRAWTRPEYLAQWWIPAPYECQVAVLDVQPGGGFQTLMRAGDDDGPFQPHVDGCFLDVVPEQRMVWTTVLTAGWQPAEPWLALTAIISFSAEDDGTRYAARVLHKNAEDAARHDELGFEAGWGAAIDQLAALTQTLK